VILEKNCLDELVKLINEDSELACVGLLLMRHQQKLPGIIQEFGGKINFKTGKIVKFFTNEDSGKVNLPQTIDTDFIGGGACFIKAGIFKTIGMFDENYFSYFDEIDLSYRLKKLNNYKMRCTSKAVAYHNHNWTKKNKYSYYFEYYLSERNKYVYFYKYGKYFSIIRSLCSDLLKFPWRLIWFVRVCDVSLGIYYLNGLFAGLFGKKGKPKLKFLS
jgi:GT2 family glycosyltransferase